MTVPLLFILRHGETEWNVSGKVQGSRDSALTENGRAQAAAQGRLLQTVMQQTPGARIMCSPLGRARATATIALRGTGKAMVLDARLREVSAGAWEGRTRAAIHAEFAETAGLTTEFDLFTKAPGGESEAQLRARCQAFLDDLTGPTVAITHGVTSLMLRGLVQGMSREEMSALPRGQGCIYRLENGHETCLREEGA